jgi:hypothetical protein
MTRADCLSLFLDALDEWGCEDNDERADEIITFFDGGCDLSAYKDRPHLKVINGGKAQERADGR